MKLFGYTIIKNKHLDELRDLVPQHLDQAKKITNLENEISFNRSHFSRMNTLNDKLLAENMRLEIFTRKLKAKIEEQEKTISKYQRIVGTNTKPKWTWEKWK